MRRSTNGGMRPVPAQTVLDSIPAGVERVGRVGRACGAAVTRVDLLELHYYYGRDPGELICLAGTRTGPRRG